MDNSSDQPDYDAMSKVHLWLLWIKSIVTPGDDRWKEIGEAIGRKGPAVVRDRW